MSGGVLEARLVLCWCRDELGLEGAVALAVDCSGSCRRERVKGNFEDFPGCRWRRGQGITARHATVGLR